MDKTIKGMKTLVLCPHADDAELGCGGTIARFIEEGKEIFCAAFSTYEKYFPGEFSGDILRTEIKKATKILGINPENLILFNYETRLFPTFRQSILDDLIRLGKQLKPDLVILPSTHDIHQDHQVISQEGIRAFRDISIIGYEMFRNNMTFPAKLFVPLTKEHINLKMTAISHYQSQAFRVSLSPIFYENLARIRGVQIGTEYAEAFEVIRWVI
jgi:LmbE family N-acetylglucosaminyl deacetylase